MAKLNTKTIVLTGTEQAVALTGQNCDVRNDGADMVYASGEAGIVAGADGVMPIPAGQAVQLRDYGGTIYLLGTGTVQVCGHDYQTPVFKGAATSSGEGGGTVDADARKAIEIHADNEEIHTSAAEKATFRRITSDTISTLPTPTKECDYMVDVGDDTFPYPYGFLSVRYGANANEFVARYDTTETDCAQYTNMYKEGSWNGWKNANDGGNANTVDGYHAWELQAVGSDGVPFGYTITANHQADDGRFKLSVAGGEESEHHDTSVDYAYNADAVDGMHAEEFALKSKYGDTTIDVGRKADTAVGANSTAEGSNTTASGSYSHAEGYNTMAGMQYSHAEGYNSIAGGEGSHAEGKSTEATGLCAHAEGQLSKATGDYSHAEGNNTQASGNYSHAGGWLTVATNAASCAIGKFSKDTMTNGASQSTSAGDVFVIGNGYVTSQMTRSNAFRITYTGEVYGLSAFNSSGADYAEFVYPWYDDNADNEDRVGYFVTCKDQKLYKATSGDLILGITSGNPSVVGNADEDYYWRYERDEFNRIVFEDVEEEIEVVDDDGNVTYEKTGNIIENGRMKLSEDYDPSQQNSYVERRYREEWSYIGMLGVIPVRDDGTCVPGQYCKCNDDGIATFASAEEAVTNRYTYIVLERVNDNVVKVLCK